MSLDLALRLTEILLGFALFLQSAEHLELRWDESGLHLVRLFFSLWMILGPSNVVAPLVLLGTGLYLIAKYRGPYNGGADRMAMLALLMISIIHLVPDNDVHEMAMGYLAIQFLLSYCLAGIAKARHREWWNGQAVTKLLSSHYVSQSTIKFFSHAPPRVLGPLLIIFELVFPLAIFDAEVLFYALAVAFLFHAANAMLLGLNRFLWVWASAFPAIIWFQNRIDL